MTLSACFPYRSEALRDSFLAYYAGLAAKQWPVTSEERFVPTSYGETFVRITGPSDAPPLVLLPGASTTSLMWAPNIQALSASYRTIALDQVGDLGRTACIRPVRRFTDLCAWLDELFDGLNLAAGIHLVGMSYGGTLAAQYALHRSERLGKIVLLAPGAIVLRIHLQFLGRLMLAAVARRRFLPPAVHWMFADMERKDPQWIAETLELLFASMRSLLPRQLPFPRKWTVAQWNDLRVPTLFLVGEHEVIYPAEKALRRLRRVAPHVQAEIIPGAGHDLPFVQPDTVNRKILDFLRLESTVACHNA